MTGDSLLYKLQHELSFAEEYKGDKAHALPSDANNAHALPSDANNAHALPSDANNAPAQLREQQLPNEEGQGQQNVADLVNPKQPLVTKESLHKAHIFTARAARAKACFILNTIDSDPASQGPTIEFVTNTVSDIFGGDTDGHEIMDRPFLSLVAPQDVTKAAVYLDSLRKTTKPQLCGLRLLRDPMGPSTRQTGDDEYINVDLFGASSEDKILLLCQKRREKGFLDAPIAPGKIPVGEVSKLPPKDDDMAQYMSLDQIISSNPDTTDVDGHWSEVMF
ncbi:hypothetical protein GGI23_001412 [Coemansia sp. RSA 2559]|nr:hypothetical protein GGI23_001412 [Coemansia sp. RSA 2559]KAJ2864978.1 hypothetical protein GGI22_001604 [Coemansia erecta]